MDIVHAQNCFVFYIYKLYADQRKNAHVLFSEMGCFPDIPFLMTDTKIKEQVSFES